MWMDGKANRPPNSIHNPQVREVLPAVQVQLLVQGLLVGPALAVGQVSRPTLDGSGFSAISKTCFCSSLSVHLWIASNVVRDTESIRHTVFKPNNWIVSKVFV